MNRTENSIRKTITKKDTRLLWNKKYKQSSSKAAHKYGS